MATAQSFKEVGDRKEERKEGRKEGRKGERRRAAGRQERMQAGLKH